MKAIIPIFLLLIGAVGGRVGAEEVPEQVQEALTKFTADVPPDWAYTLRTRKGSETSLERYDPARPDGQHWQLLEHDGRPPTAQETERYQRYRITVNATTPRPTFRRGDLDLATCRLIGTREGLEEYACRFRADVNEPLLSRLELRFWVSRGHMATISRYSLHLVEAYSPILGLNFKALDVTVTLSAAESDKPSLPLRSHSVFHGSILVFKSIDEETTVEYSDYEKRGPGHPPTSTSH